MTPRTVIRVLALLAMLAGAAGAAFAAGSPVPAAAGAVSDSAWKAVAASGPVAARDPGASADAWRRVVRGTHLAPLSQIQTGRRGRATLTNHASVLIVDPESRVELPAVQDGVAPRRVLQDAGRVIYEVDGSKVSDFRVVTPYLVAGVKGTVFLVTVTDRYASVSVERGVVEVLSVSTEERAEIRAGETALVHAEEGAELEIVRQRAADRDASEASREAGKIARRAAERLEKDEGPLVDDDQGKEDPLVDDPLVDPLPDPLKDNPTDPLKDTLDRATEEAASSDAKSANGTRTN